MKTQEDEEWKVHAHDETEIKLAEKLAELLWDYLKRVPEQKDRRRINGGSKTKLGLLRTVQYVLNNARYEMLKHELQTAAIRAEELFGVDECERFAEELRQRRKRRLIE